MGAVWQLQQQQQSVYWPSSRTACLLSPENKTSVAPGKYASFPTPLQLGLALRMIVFNTFCRSHWVHFPDKEGHSPLPFLLPFLSAWIIFQCCRSSSHHASMGGNGQVHTSAMTKDRERMSLGLLWPPGAATPALDYPRQGLSSEKEKPDHLPFPVQLSSCELPSDASRISLGVVSATFWVTLLGKNKSRRLAAWEAGQLSYPCLVLP